MSQTNQFTNQNQESIKVTTDVSPTNQDTPHLTEFPDPLRLVPELENQPIEASEVNPKDNVEDHDNSFIWKLLGGTLLVGGATTLALGGRSKGGSSISRKTNNQTTVNDKAKDSTNSDNSLKGAEKQDDSSTKVESNTTLSDNISSQTGTKQDQKTKKDEYVSQKDTSLKEEHNTSTEPKKNEPPTITTKIYYPNGDVITHSGKTALDLNHIAYKTFSAQPANNNEQEKPLYIDKNHPAFNGLKAGTEAYIAGKSQDEIQAIIEASFQVDTDHDGMIDSTDKNPNVWNVSDRDLRIFSTFAYESKDALENAFNQGDLSKIKKELSDGSIKVGDTDVTNVDLDTLTENWELLQFGTPGSGLQYAVFGNGKKDDGSYQNVVVAFRGTTSLSDLTADLKIYNGNVPTQATYLDNLADSLAQYKADNLYSTGHSLGGYLAQYFATKSVQNSVALQDSFKHSALFNPVPLPNEKATAPLRQLSDEWTNTTMNEENYNQTSSYVIKGEMVYDGDPSLSSKLNAVGWGSALLGLFTGGLGTLLGLAAGALTAANQDALKALAKGLKGYDNTDIIDLNNGMTSPMDLHKMVRFYDQHGELKAAFTNGYRMDNHYINDDIDQDGLTDYQEAKIGTNIHLLDTDGDGITDAIEIKLGANALDKETTPWATGNGLSYFDETPMLITAEVIENGETTIKGIVLTPEQKADGVFYRVTEVMENLGVPSPLLHNDNTSANNLVQLLGSDGDDKIEIGSGSILIQSGNGNDTIEFRRLNPNKVAYLDDFDASHDKLLFAKETFSDLNAFQYNQAQGQLSYKNTHFATFEQGLELDIQRFELI